MEPEQIAPAASPQAQPRPTGVWVLCLLNLWLGVVAVAGVVIFHVVPEARAAVQLDLIATIVSVTLGAALALASILAWWGFPLWRDVMLYTVSVHLALIIWNAASMLGSELPAEKLWVVIVRSVVILVVNWLYFKSERPKAFYARQSDQAF